MIQQKHIQDILENYNPTEITIGTLGGHSGLEVCRGAKLNGFRSVAVCQKGREKTYQKYYKSRGDKGVVDEIIVVNKFSDIVKDSVQQKLRAMNTIFVHNRYFWVYCNFADIEKKFKVPIYGTRGMVKLEERDVPNNQYAILQKAGIRIPKLFSSYQKINKPVMVKVAEAQRGYERAFFVANSPASYKEKAQQLLKAKQVTQAGLKKAVIEEYAVGAQVNFNFFYSPLTDELELMGTDTRRQTNLDGLLRLTAPEQIEALKVVQPKMIETGHYTVTVKESLLEKIFALGEKFVKTAKKIHPPGIIGPFALQGAVIAEDGKEDIVIFDVSMRIPGSPGTMFTPYSAYLHHQPISYGDRIAREIRTALDQDELHRICT